MFRCWKLPSWKNFYNSKFMLSTTSNSITSSEKDGIRRLVLNNPSKRNAMSLNLMNELISKLTYNVSDPSLRCVILSANGPAFSAGHDLSELRSNSGIKHHEFVFSTCSQLISSIRNLPIPVIAQVNGLATAAGCQLVASCDIVIASEKSSFSTPGANVGLFCSTPGVAITRSLPRKLSAYMLFTGLPISAKEAVLYGLVSKVVPEESLEEETLKIASVICNVSRPVIELGKKFYYSQLEKDINSAYRDGERTMVENLRLEDAQNGITAFIEKRKPVWQHTDRKSH